MFTMLIVATIILAVFAYAPDVRAEGGGQRDRVFTDTSFNDIVLNGMRQDGVVPIGGQIVTLLDGTTRNVSAP